jgi:hypothetical protein
MPPSHKAEYIVTGKRPQIVDHRRKKNRYPHKKRHSQRIGKAEISIKIQYLVGNKTVTLVGLSTPEPLTRIPSPDSMSYS